MLFKVVLAFECVGKILEEIVFINFVSDRIFYSELKKVFF